MGRHLKARRGSFLFEAKLLIFLKNTRRKALDLVLTGEGHFEVGAGDTVVAGVLDSRCGTLLSTSQLFVGKSSRSRTDRKMITRKVD